MVEFQGREDIQKLSKLKYFGRLRINDHVSCPELEIRFSHEIPNRLLDDKVEHFSEADQWISTDDPAQSTDVAWKYQATQLISS